MKKVVALASVVVFVLGICVAAFATSNAPAAESAAPAPKAKIMRITGEITALDAKAMTLTVKGKKGDVSLVADEKTKVLIGKEVKGLSDLKVGDKVTVKYTEKDGKMVAKSISAKAAPAAPAAPHK